MIHTLSTPDFRNIQAIADTFESQSVFKNIISTKQWARSAQRYRASQQLYLIINRHFFRLHHLAFDFVNGQPGVAEFDKAPHVVRWSCLRFRPSHTVLASNK